MKSLEQQFSEDLSIRKSSNSGDSMIIKTIGLLDERDEEVLMNAKRVKEWYGFHFPELSKIIEDNIQYVKSVKIMGNRINASQLDFSEILADKVGEMELKEAALVSKGIEVSDLELMRIRELCDQVLLLAEDRVRLYDNLITRMNHVAPNLSAIVGELLGARLISHGGGFMNLVKQCYVAKLFRALLTKKYHIPKHGLVYQVSQAAPKLKKKMTWSLAAKATIAIRCDAFGDGLNNTIGIKNREKLEARFKFLANKKGKPKFKVPKTSNTDDDYVLVQMPTKSESEAVEEMNMSQ